MVRKLNISNATFSVGFLLVTALIIQVLAQHVWFFLKVTIGLREEFLLLRVIAMPLVLAAFFISILNWSGKVQANQALCVFAVILNIVLGVVIAAGDQNSLRYAVGDLMRFAVPWMAFISVSLLLNVNDNPKFTKYLLAVFSSIAFIDAFGVVVSSLVLPTVRLSSDFFLLLLAIAFHNLMNRFSLKDTLILIFVLACVVLTGKRATLLGVAITVLVLFYLNGLLNRRLIILLLVALLIGAMTWFTNIGLEYERISYFLKQTQSLAKMQDDASIWGRVYELFNILDSYHGKPYYYFTGQGFGAEVEMNYYTGVFSDNGQMHHAHSSLLVYFWRTGILGLSLFILVTILLLRSIRLTRKKLKKTIYPAIIAFSIYGLASSVKSNYFLENISYPMLLAFLNIRNMKKITEASNERNV